ncbi:hypothetical protein GGD81_001873 [Rhodobium orientis]|uniref:Lipocalin-like domain-containing protein n=1 Tax=Rhodobium orientis TaxID=34017 RepID=A0A327JIW5_9HYPH|nr:hypothetical protein [Rhodobium orientis]MBB4302837.1 hypothetical protein [Rhodobium orientis]RAI26259.1 hypothetical protein CH339_14835 [Rhodobium orientis]
MKYIVIGLVAVALLGCQTTVPAPAPTPDTHSVVAPSADVPSDVAEFSGVWTGSWDVAGGPPLDANLTVQTVSATGHVTALYAVGDSARDQFSAHSTPVSGDITGNTLTLDPFKNGAQASYTMMPDGSLQGRYERSGQTAHGTFLKQEAAPQTVQPAPTAYAAPQGPEPSCRFRWRIVAPGTQDVVEGSMRVKANQPCRTRHIGRVGRRWTYHSVAITRPPNNGLLLTAGRMGIRFVPNPGFTGTDTADITVTLKRAGSGELVPTIVRTSIQVE